MAKIFSRLFLLCIFASGFLFADEKPNVSMTETYWKLLSVGKMHVSVPEDQREPHMRLHEAKPEVDGFGGCNYFHGKFKLHEKTITFSPLQSTRMFCSQIKTEDMFYETLRETASYQIKGEFLTLYDKNTKKLAYFQAIYMM